VKPYFIEHLKRHCTGQSVDDIKLPRERLETRRLSMLSKHSFGTLMSYTDRPAQRCFNMSFGVYLTSVGC